MADVNRTAERHEMIPITKGVFFFASLLRRPLFIPFHFYGRSHSSRFSLSGRLIQLMRDALPRLAIIIIVIEKCPSRKSESETTYRCFQ